MVIQECCFNLSNNKRKACWLLTTRCNFNCSYCAVSSAHHENISSISDWSSHAKHVLKMCRENSIEKIILSGGEPLLVREIVEIVGILSESGIKVSLSTNGSLLAPTMLHNLKRAGLSKIVIGLHWAANIVKETSPADRLRELAWNVHNAKIAHEYSIVLTPYNLSVIGDLSSIVRVSSPLAVNLIELQYCGRMRINEDARQKVADPNLECTPSLAEVFAPIKTVLVRPLCHTECPSEKQIFGISGDLKIDVCPWKKYLDLTCRLSSAS